MLIAVLAFLIRLLLHRTINRVVEGAVNSRVPRVTGRAPRLHAAGNAPAMSRRAQRVRTMGSVLRSLSSAIVLTIASIMVLAEFGVDLGPILASAGIVGVAVGFGAQNLVRDFLSGMFMVLEDQYGVGDVVDVGDASGTVEAVGLRITTIRDVKGTVWYARNGEILRVGNMSQGHAVAVVDVPIGHGADIPAVIEVVSRAAATRVEHADIAESVLEPPKVLGVEKVAPEGVTLRLTVKVKPAQQWAVQRALNAAIADAFETAEVPRPAIFPSATINV